METTLVVGDFLYIALIVIFLGGASGMATNNLKGLSEKIDNIEQQLIVLVGEKSDSGSE